MAVTKNISLSYEGGIILGKRGENAATEIVFDISSLISTYGDGTAILLAKRSMDDSAYPVTDYEQDDDAGTMTWTVNNVDTNYLGRGQIQLFWYVGGTTLAKTYLWPTIVLEDITGVVGDAPDAYESWLETLTDTYAEEIEDVKAQVYTAEAWAVGTYNGEDVDEDADQYQNNSKYWAEQSAASAVEAENWADEAEQAAATAGYMEIEMDEYGHLIYTRTDAVDVDFEIDDTGHLIMEAV